MSDLTRFQPELYLTQMDNLEFLVRILLAAVLGMVIGIERSRRLKEAGIRTHCIVAMASAIFMILSKYAFVDLDASSIPGVRGADAARIAAQVVSGISFLGAGIIFKHGKNSVRGLTTAAGMWATSAVGMSIGAGLYWVGIGASGILLVLQLVLHRHQFGGDTLKDQEIRIRMKDEEKMKEIFHNWIERHQCIIENSSIVRKDDEILITFEVRAGIPFDYNDGIEFLREVPGISELKIETL